MFGDELMFLYSNGVTGSVVVVFSWLFETDALFNVNCLTLLQIFIFKNTATFTFIRLADAFIQTDLHCVLGIRLIILFLCWELIP